MTLTLGQVLLLIGLLVLGTIITIFAFFMNEKVYGFTLGGITLVLLLGLSFGLNWYNTNTAAGIRNYKDYQSNMDNGIEREITITAEDGREIFHYEGKVDIEANHTDNYIKFESEDGKRYMIFYGVQDTILIVEK